MRKTDTYEGIVRLRRRVGKDVKKEGQSTSTRAECAVVCAAV